METPKTNLDMGRFEGLYSNYDPHDVRPGQAQVQVNCTSDKAGQLVTRPGLLELSFETLNP